MPYVQVWCFGRGTLTDCCFLKERFFLSLQVVKPFILVSSFNRTEALAGDGVQVWWRPTLCGLMPSKPQALKSRRAPVLPSCSVRLEYRKGSGALCRDLCKNSNRVGEILWRGQAQHLHAERLLYVLRRPD